MDNPLGNKDLTNKTLGGQFKLIRRLGMGAFGEIYLAVNKNKEEFAIKIERVKCEFPQIMYESKVYAILHANKPVGIPKIFGANTEGEYNYLTMELLGSSIEDIFISCSRKLSLKSVLMLADQMITRIELLHSCAFIHRDIKPDNFLMGINQNQHKLYVVDMGLVKKYITREGHIPYKEGKPLTGTARYASINAHLGYEQSRRDDLEGLAYVLVYLAKGQLPWMNLKSANQNDKYEKIKDKKIKTTPEELCKGLPIEINQYLNYIRKLKFEERPDYEMCRQLFKNAMKANNLTYDYKFEWIKGKYEIQSQKSNIQVSPDKTVIQPAQQVKPQQKIQSPPKKQVQVPAAQVQSPRVINPKQQVPQKRIQSAQRPQQKNPIPQKPTQPVTVQAPRIVLNKEPYTKY